MSTECPAGRTGGTSDAALWRAAVHLAGGTRAFLFQIEAILFELGSLHDARTGRVVEALELATVEPATPGTLRHLEQVASQLVRDLHRDQEE